MNKSLEKLATATFLIVLVCICPSLAQTKKSAKATKTKSKSTKIISAENPVKTSLARSENDSGIITAANGPTPIVTDSGLVITVTRSSMGTQLKMGDNVIVNYSVLLENGEKFDSSFDRNTPFSFPIGEGMVIKGWDEAMLKLRVGDRATIIIPNQLGFGARGLGKLVPPFTNLIVVVEVVGVK
jgi:peptidylprolyl isomerase